jgi:hypothetical protein
MTKVLEVLEASSIFIAPEINQRIESFSIRYNLIYILVTYFQLLHIIAEVFGVYLAPRIVTVEL